MEMAQREFEVPEGTKILLVFPEIFDRDILSLYPEQFGYKYSDAGQGSANGVQNAMPLLQLK
jgi:hypothetical protein